MMPAKTQIKALLVGTLGIMLLVLSLHLLKPPKTFAVIPQSGDALHVRISTELEEFTDWLADNNASGLIGEFSWPGTVSDDEQEQWNLLAESWFRDADAANLWATAFHASRAETTDSTTGMYVNSTGNDPDVGSIDTSQPQHEVMANHLQTDDYKRGITVYGTTFGANMDGSLDENAAVYPSQNDLDYLSSQGIGTIRMSIRWERIQRDLFGDLNTTELTKINNVLTAAANASPNPIDVILTLGDNARYWYTPDGLTARTEYKMKTSGGNLNTEHLKDIWGKFSDEFKVNDTVIAYALMNEPYDLSAETTSFSGTTLYDWDDGTTQGWSGSSMTLTNDTTYYYGSSGGSLKVVKTGLTPDSYNNFLFGSPGSISGSGNGLSCKIMLDSGASGSWHALVGWQNSSYATEYGSNFNLAAGEWVNVSHEFDDLSTINNMIIQIETVGTPSPSSVTLYVDDCGRGTVSSLTGAQVWEQISQDTLTYLRTTKNDSKTIIIPGYDYSSVSSWTTNHPDGWITDPDDNFLYEGHHYWDRNSSSFYTHTYDEEVTDAESTKGYSATGTAAPTGSVTINSGSSSTTSSSVTLTISASDDVDTTSTIQMQVSNASDFVGASWEDYSSSKSWTISSSLGDHTVYIKFRDAGGYTSSTYSDSITLADISISSPTSIPLTEAGPPICGATKPLGAPIVTKAETLSSTKIKLYFTDATGPVDKYVLEYGESYGRYQYSSVNIGGLGIGEYTVSSLSQAKTYYFRVRAGNGCAAGDWSNVIAGTTSGSIGLTQPTNSPTSTTISNASTPQPSNLLLPSLTPSATSSPTSSPVLISPSPTSFFSSPIPTPEPEVNQTNKNAYLYFGIGGVSLVTIIGMFLKFRH